MALLAGESRAAFLLAAFGLAVVGCPMAIRSEEADKLRLPSVPCAPVRPAPLSSLGWILIEARFGGLIPISPYWDAEIEDADKTRIANLVEPVVPTPEQILEAIPNLADRGLFVTETRQNVTIVLETIVDSLGEKRFYPEVGPARLRKRHFKCIVQYDRIRHHAWPFDYTTAETARAVVYCDRDRLVVDAP